ncbi:MAG: hypothetical protein WC379_14745 [Methanoregula sp.]|jgi:hypothetical protein
MEKNYLVLIFLFVAGIVIAILISQSGHYEFPDSASPNQKINIAPFHISGTPTYLTFDVTDPVIPKTVLLYKGKIEKTGSIDILLGNQKLSGRPTISEDEAPEVARQVLEQYGGLPHDAILSGTTVNYLYTKNSSTKQIVATTPTDTTVFYNRKIDGLPVVGQSDRIIVELGVDGEPLWIYKYWRTIEYTGETVPIVSLDIAVERLKNNEILEKPMDLRDVTIDNISLGYYEKNRSDPEILFEPVLIFKGKTSSVFPFVDKSAGNPVTLIVSALPSSNYPIESMDGLTGAGNSIVATSSSSDATKRW